MVVVVVVVVVIVIAAVVVVAVVRIRATTEKNLLVNPFWLHSLFPLFCTGGPIQ